LTAPKNSLAIACRIIPVNALDCVLAQIRLPFAHADTFKIIGGKGFRTKTTDAVIRKGVLCKHFCRKHLHQQKENKNMLHNKMAFTVNFLITVVGFSTEDKNVVFKGGDKKGNS